MSQIDAPGNYTWSIGNYGQRLREGKAMLRAAFDAVGVDEEMRKVLLAIAFQETDYLTNEQRDYSKDQREDGSANVSLFNLSVDLVRRVGAYAGSPWDLNSDSHLADAVRVIVAGVTQWGINALLNYVRGGYTAFQDGTSYGAGEYRNAIRTIYNVISNDTSLMWDDRRVQTDLGRV